MASMERKIKQAFENAAPNVLDSVLAECETKVTDIVPMTVKKPRFVVLRYIATAAMLVLFVGIGALAGSLVGHLGHSDPKPTETQPIVYYPPDSEVLRSYCQLTGKDYEAVINRVSIRYYWQTNDVFAFFIDDLEAYENTVSSFILEEMEFLLPTTQPLYFYSNHICASFETPSQLFRILTAEELEVFYDYHASQQETLYDRNNWPEKATLNCPAHLTSQKRAEIEAAMGWNYYSTDAFWYQNDFRSGLRYYGSFNGYDIMFYDGGERFFNETIQVVADFAFGSNSTFSLLVHKDGQITNLDETYDSGIISKEAIAVAWEYHNLCTNSDMISTCRPAAIRSRHEDAVENAWSKIRNEPFGTWYSENNPDGDWRYYDGDILFYCGGEQEEIFTSVKIGEYFFSHPTTFQLYTINFATQELFELSEYYSAHQNDSEIAAAAKQHLQTQNSLYGADWLANVVHNFENTVLREPTCSDPGAGINVCKDCGYSIACEYECKPHTYYCRALVFASCQQVGSKEYYCKDCDDSYIVETPKTDHYWENSHSCTILAHCRYCDALHDPMHAAVQYGTASSPTDDRAGIQTNYCQRCGQYFHNISGNTGDYMLYVLEYHVKNYAKSLGFEYKENFPQSADAEYEYAEFYSVIESMGGQEALLARSYELVDKLYADVLNMQPSDPSEYTLWFTIEYLVDKDNRVGAFRIYTFISA